MTTHNHDVLLAIDSRIINGRSGGAKQLNADYKALIKARGEILKLRKALAQPAQRKPLTDEEIADIVVAMNGNEPSALFWRDLARAIEAAHGIKENT